MSEKKILYLLTVISFLFPFLGACDMFEAHPYDVHITGKRDINATNIPRIAQVCASKDTIRFVMMGDSQRWYDETEDFVSAVNRRSDIDFVIHGGDLSDFGATKEFLWQRDILEKMKMPYVVLIGNHDCLGTGEQVFKSLFGKLNFSFMAGKIKFICMNTNAFEYDYSNPVPDFGFMENELTTKIEGHEKSIVVMHAPPFGEQFNNNVAKVFQRYVIEFKGLQFCLYAHNHALQVSELFGDGVLYYGSDCMKNRNYLLFTIYPDKGYKYEVVYF